MIVSRIQGLTIRFTGDGLAQIIAGFLGFSKSLMGKTLGLWP